MVRIQIRLTPEQARVLKQMAAREGKSIAGLIRISVDALVQAGGIKDEAELRRKAIAAAGKLHGPPNLAAQHDERLAESFDPCASRTTS